MKTAREQVAFYLVLLLALAVGAYILGSEITNAGHLEEAIR